MPRDYAKRSKPAPIRGVKSKPIKKRSVARSLPVSQVKMRKKRRSRSKLPWRRIILICLLLGLIFGAGNWFLNHPIQKAAVKRLPPSPQEKPSLVTLPPPSPPMVKPVFVFQDVPVSAKDNTYELQLGDFPTGNALTAVEARLTKLQLKFAVNEIHHNSEIYFRVTVGSFASEAQAVEIQDQLENHKIYSVLRKLP